MAERPRHPNPALEALIRDAEAKGWRVKKGRKYFHAYCPCPAKHSETIHMTPTRNYEKNKRNKMSHCPSWKEA